MAQSRGRKTSTKRTTSKKKNTSRAKEQFDTSLIDEVIFLVFLAIAILLFLCNFHIIGDFGDALSNFMYGICGHLAYVFPLLLFFAVYFGIANIGNTKAIIKLVAGIVLFCMIDVFFTLVSHVDELGSTFGEFYSYSATFHKGGGIIGGFLGHGMYSMIDMAGSVIIMLLLMIICFVLLTEKSFKEGVKKQSRRVSEFAKSDFEYHREKAALMAQERALRNQERQLQSDSVQPSSQNVATDKQPKELRMNKKSSGILSAMDLTFQNLKKDFFEDSDFEDSVDLDASNEMKEDSTSTSTSSSSASTQELTKNSTTESSKTDQESVREAISKIKIRGVDDVKTDPEHREMGVEASHNPNIHADTAEIPNVEKELAKQSVTNSASNTSSNTLHTSSTSDLDNHTSTTASLQSSSVKSNKPKKKYIFPSLNLLSKVPAKKTGGQGDDLRNTAVKLQETLHSFGVEVKVTDISQGPAVTRFELQPEVGVKVSKIVNLADDLKLSLAATDIRIEAPIPGKSAVGIEVPNAENSAVGLRELLESNEFKKADYNLIFSVGKDIAGEVVVTNIAKMPHLLIAGSTGSGKSVCINTIIMSILYKASPEDVKLIMIDPKVVELSVYNGIPHLMVPVVTDPKKAAAALAWGVHEMEDRYKKFADMNVRDLAGYNKKVESMTENNGQPLPEKLPQILIIVDELADLMMVAGNEVEASICRLAQLARACGIHLIIATQRPSVDVITGLIKANMPSRVAFAVSSGVDSRTILDMVGAEKLLGKGDMLFYPQGYTKPARIQGAFVSDAEVSAVVDFIKNQGIESDDSANVVEEQLNKISSTGGGSGFTDSASDRDALFEDAGRFIIGKEKASIGALQRVFKIGFNRAARIMDQLEEAGVVGPEEGTKPRRVLMSMEQFEETMNV